MDETQQIDASIRDLERKVHLLTGLVWGGLVIVLLLDVVRILFSGATDVIVVMKNTVVVLQVACILWQFFIITKMRRLQRQAKILNELKARAYWDRIYASQEPIGQHGRIELIENEDGSFSLP